MGGVPKRGYNSFHKYAYRTEEDVMEKLRSLCTEHGVFVRPTCVGCSLAGDITTVEMEYEVINADNPEERFTARFPGTGQDKGDKGLYKAFTGSYKYFSMKTFQISSEDDPERDEEQTPRNGSTPRKQPAPAAPPYDPAVPGNYLLIEGKWKGKRLADIFKDEATRREYLAWFKTYGPEGKKAASPQTVQATIQVVKDLQASLLTSPGIIYMGTALGQSVDEQALPHLKNYLQTYGDRLPPEHHGFVEGAIKRMSKQHAEAADILAEDTNGEAL